MVLLKIAGMTRSGRFHHLSGKPHAGLHLVEFFNDVVWNAAMNGQLHLGAALFKEKDSTA